MVKHTKGFKGLSKKVLSAILAASMIMTSSSFVMAAEPNDGGEIQENTAVVASVTDEREVQVEVAETCVYNGEEQKPSVVVKVNNGGRWDTVDPSKYELSYSNNTHATTEESKAQVKVTFTSEIDEGSTIGVHASVTKEFEILPLDLNDPSNVVTVSTDQTVRGFVYNGEEQYPAINSVTVKTKVGDTTKELTLSANDYDVVPGRGNLTSAGNHNLAISGKGDYTGSVTEAVAYTIDPAKLSEDLVNVSVKDYVYDDAINAQRVKDLITVTDKATEQELDFDVVLLDWPENTTKPVQDIGTYRVRIKANANTTNFEADSYIDTTFNIVANQSLDTMVKAAVKDEKFDNFEEKDGVLTSTYDGSDQYLEDDVVELKGLKSTEYKIVTPDAEWINAGDYEIVVEGRNTYEGQTATIPVKIAPKQINTGKKVLNDAGKIEVTATQGKHQSGSKGEVILYITDDGLELENKETYTLEEGVDYTYTIEEKTNNKSDVVVTGIGNYTTVYGDEDDENVYVQEVKTTNTLDLNDPSISVEVTGEYVWNGKQIKPGYDAIKVTEKDGSTVRTLSKDEFGVAYGDNKNVGEGTITLSGKTPYYSGDRVVTFEIKGVSFADTFNVADIDDFVKGTKNYNDVISAAKVTYKTTGASYDQIKKTLYKDGEVVTNVNETGAYTLVVEPTNGQFEGKIEVNFNVIGQDLKKSGAKIADIADQVYTSEAIEPDVVVTIGNKTLEEGKDYTVSYTDNVKGGEATAIVTGIGEYSGTIEKNFNITRAAQSIVMTNPLQERDLANGSRNTKSKVCTLKLATTMADEDTKYTYKSSDLSVATVNDGKITYKGVGECTITVTAAETDSCEAASLDITVKVGKPGQPTFTPSVSSKTAKKSITVTSSTVRGADGFEVQYSVRSDWWRASTVDFDGTNGKLYRQTIKTYHSNKKYYIRVRAYQVVDGAKVYSDWSPAKTATTK